MSLQFCDGAKTELKKCVNICVLEGKESELQKQRVQTN